MSRQHNRLVAIAFTLWAGLVSAGFFAANGGYLLEKLAERGLLP